MQKKGNGTQSQETPTFVYMHENQGNLVDRMSFYNMLINKVDVNVLAVSYRGYSGN